MKWLSLLPKFCEFCGGTGEALVSDHGHETRLALEPCEFCGGTGLDQIPMQFDPRESEEAWERAVGVADRRAKEIRRKYLTEYLREYRRKEKGADPGETTPKP